MAEPRRGLTAEERFEALQRDREVLRRERLLSGMAGPCWHRMLWIVPVLFRLEGTLAVRALLGQGFLAIQEVHAYLTTLEPLDRLARAGLISSEPLPDTTLVRPWPGRPRLLACIVEELPPSRQVAGGFQVVTAERLARELIGAVGPRADLFALLETAEAKSSS